jgi:hypothetical protein
VRAPLLSRLPPSARARARPRLVPRPPSGAEPARAPGGNAWARGSRGKPPLLAPKPKTRDAREPAVLASPPLLPPRGQHTRRAVTPASRSEAPCRAAGGSGWCVFLFGLRSRSSDARAPTERRDEHAAPFLPPHALSSSSS